MSDPDYLYSNPKSINNIEYDLFNCKDDKYCSDNRNVFLEED